MRGANIFDGGKRQTKHKRNSIRFQHDISSTHGYGYSYKKTVSLTRGKVEMVISYELANFGTKPISTSVLNHGFFQVDAEPAGPGLIWTFPWRPVAGDAMNGMAEVQGDQIVYKREIHDGERLLTTLTGYRKSPADHRFTLLNKTTGAGIRVIADPPIAKLKFWSRRLAYAPEASVQISIEPGAKKAWQTSYEFYLTQGQD